MIGRISLQSRLLALFGLLLAIFWTAMVVDVQRRARDDAARQVDIRLRAMAQVILTVAPGGAADRADVTRLVDMTGRALGVDRLGTPDYEVRRGDAVLLRSGGFPALDPPPGPGLRVVAAQGVSWTVLTIAGPGDDVTRRTALPRRAEEEWTDALIAERTAPLNVMLPLFGIGVLGSIWLGLRPLRRIRQRIAAIDPNAPAGLGLPPDRMPHEIAALARAFDALAARLARVMSGQRIFASVASHELRTPLAGAVSQLDVLRRDPGSARAQDLLSDSLGHMDRLIAQLLALARDEDRVAAKGPARFDPHALTRDLCAALGLDDPRARLDLAPPPDHDATMTGYPDLIRAMLRNLIQNGLRASGGGPVRLMVTATPDHVRIAVADPGPGFPARYSRDRFDAFAARPGGQGPGHGLGLIIAQRIAELHRGRIDLADTAEGAQVTVTLPRTPRQGRAG